MISPLPVAVVSPEEVFGVLLPAVETMTFPLESAVSMVLASVESMVISTGSISQLPVLTCKEVSEVKTLPEVSTLPVPSPVVIVPPA